MNYIRLFVWLGFLVTLHVTAQGQSQRKGSMKKPFVFSQQFKHSAGAGVSLYSLDKKQEPVYHVDYHPSLSLTNSWSDFSISAGIPVSAGYHLESDADTLEYFYARIPLQVEFNFGHNASKDFYNDLGWFLGGGYAYHLFREEWLHAPVITIGARAFIFGPSFTLRYSRYFATAENDRSLNSISLLLNMGRYFEQVKLNNKVSRFK